MNRLMADHARLMQQGFTSSQAICLIGLRSQIATGLRSEYPFPKRSGIRTTPDLRGIERLPEKHRPVGKKRRGPASTVTGTDLLCAGLLVAGMYALMAAAWGVVR